ncbi:MAG: 50S ribosomal protein L17 [Deltaproteobacteria bacterium]|nr:50S ribosomal protein L17 [Deltaproteobacteria bacterium]MBW2253198.1 50S ribosomal protein L17 [Deltaproteobacteria bacterium]
MRHRKAGRKLGMDSSARKAMFKNMVTSLLLHGTIRTTEARAKELRRYADRIVTIGKKAPSITQIDALEGDAKQKAEAARVHAIRRTRQWVNNDDAVTKVFGEYAERFRARPGGYTRVVKAGRRDGDNAAMAVIQLVEAFEAKEPEEAVSETEPEDVEVAPEGEIEDDEAEA